LGLQPSEMLEVVADRDVWRINLELFPPQPSRHERALKEEDNAYKDLHSNFKALFKSFTVCGWIWRFCVVLQDTR